MSGPFSSEQEAQAFLDAGVRRQEMRLDVLTQVGARVEQLSADGISPRKAVRVTLGHDALVRDVEFFEASLHLSALTLAAEVRHAHANALSSLAALVDEIAGEDLTGAPASVRDSLTLPYREAAVTAVSDLGYIAAPPAGS